MAALEQPAPADTDLFRAGQAEEAKRIGTPREIAEVVNFLASDNASWVHGQIVQPTGRLI